MFYIQKSQIKHLSFFLLPDSLQALEERIKNRGGLDKKQIAERLKIAKKLLNYAMLCGLKSKKIFPMLY